MISVATSFYRTPTVASSKVDTVKRHDCSPISAVYVESPWVLASQWARSCFLKVLRTSIATRVTYSGKWSELREAEH